MTVKKRKVRRVLRITLLLFGVAAALMYISNKSLEGIFGWYLSIFYFFIEYIMDSEIIAGLDVRRR